MNVTTFNVIEQILAEHRAAEYTADPDDMLYVECTCGRFDMTREEHRQHVVDVLMSTFPPPRDNTIRRMLTIVGISALTSATAVAVLYALLKAGGGL
jgi:hypothetical protein